ncbi:MAG: saccharopine dehydrogenase NADP-binding domain-containing protein [Verrucomicrobiota bacterium]
MSDSKFDIILYGATGFTGKLTAAYLDQHLELAGRKWAIAGRNRASLEAVRKTLRSDSVEIIVCPLDESAPVKEMVRSAHMVITTAGPFSAYNGDILLAACAEEGTHYSDLSGEGFWQREMIDTYHETAKASGAKIILGGGVDSIPSDLGVFLALKQLGVSSGNNTRVYITGVYTEYSGSFSGGTLASGRAREKALESGRLTETAMHDPYILAPGRKARPDEEATLDGMPENFRIRFEPAHGALIPFFMADVNAPIVRRTLALDGLCEKITYRECCSVGMWAKAAWLYISRGFGYPMGEPINFNPKSGEGPPRWLLEQGQFALNIFARTEDGRKARVVVKGKGDPGYGATSKMLAELALCVIGKRSGKPDSTGLITPAIALGDALVQQLQSAQNGKYMQFKIN